MIDETRAGSVPDSQDPPSDEAIRLRSQEIWESEGRPEGLALDHWVRARAELEAEMARMSASRRIEPDNHPIACVPAAPGRAVACEVKAALPAARTAVFRPTSYTAPARWRPPLPEPAKQAKPNAAAPSIISADLVLFGTVETAGDLHLEGRVEGTIRCASLTVGEKAVVAGDIIADNVIVHGTVEGTIEARKLFLCATSRVDGEVMYEAISVEQGAEMNATFRYISDLDALAETWAAELLNDDVATPPQPAEISDTAA